MGEQLEDVAKATQVPHMGELDELETFVGSKKIKFGARLVVDHILAGILVWVLDRRDCKTFEPLWRQVKAWQSSSHPSSSVPQSSAYAPLPI